MPSHYLNQCRVIVNWTLRHNLQWNSNQNTRLFIHENVCEISPAKWWPFCSVVVVVCVCVCVCVWGGGGGGGSFDYATLYISLQWRHYERNGVSNHQTHDCILNRLIRRTSTKTSKLRITGLCEGNSPVTGEFPAQRVSNVENVSIWWRHHVLSPPCPVSTANTIQAMPSPQAVCPRVRAVTAVTLLHRSKVITRNIGHVQNATPHIRVIDKPQPNRETTCKMRNLSQLAMVSRLVYDVSYAKGPLGMNRFLKRSL